MKESDYLLIASELCLRLILGNSTVNKILAIDKKHTQFDRKTQAFLSILRNAFLVLLFLCKTIAAILETCLVVTLEYFFGPYHGHVPTLINNIREMFL